MMAANNIQNVIKDVSGTQSSALSPEVQAQNLVRQVAEDLHQRLSACEVSTGWKDYEDICGEILEFSLKGVLRSVNVNRQASTWDNTQRMDLVVANLPAKAVGFFHEVRTTAEPVEYLIFECKDYKDGIGPQQILQAKSYEISGAGKLRFIMTRELPKDAAVKAIKHWQQYYGVKVLVLTDKEMHELIDAALAGPDDVEQIFDKLSLGDRTSWYFGH